MTSFNIVGKPTPLIDAPEKVSGLATYVADIRVPNMLEAKVLRSPHAHARILHIDTSESERLPGVKSVITAKDCPTSRWGWSNLKDQSILAEGKVRFAGEEIAAVAAETLEVAQDAADLIRVEYEPLPAVFDPEEAMAEGAPLIHDRSENIAYEVHIERGDSDNALKTAAAVHEATYTTQLQYQAYMEPIGSVAKPEGQGRYTLWTPLQHLFLSRDLISSILNIEKEKLRLIQPFVGGAFGGKALEEPNSLITLLLAMKSGRPVRLFNTRLDEFTSARPRVPSKVWLRMRADEEGRLLSKEARVIADNGASTGLADAIMRTSCYRADSIYRINYIRTDGFLAYTNKIPTGAFRGFGNPQGTFPQECHMDVLANQLSMDPAEFRIRNAVQPGEITAHGWKIDSCGLTDCIKTAIENSNWKEIRSNRANSKFKRGIGLACAIHVSGNRMFSDWDGSRAEIEVDSTGKIFVRTGEGDIGQGSRTVAAIVAAEELKVDLDQISVSQSDTKTTPYSLGAYASRLALVAGNAVRLAAENAREKLLQLAGELLEVAADDLTIEAGSIYVKSSPQQSISFKEVCREAVFRNGGKPLQAEGEWDPPTQAADPETIHGNIAAAYEFAAQVAEVEVDTETGHVRVLRMTAADDVGRILNPLAAHGQVEGAIAQGTGFALSEEIKIEDGQVVNGNFGDYTLPKAETLPQIQSIMIESNDPHGPYGAKGASEAAIVPTAPAIANAIFHATGVRVTSLPVTAEVLKEKIINMNSNS